MVTARDVVESIRCPPNLHLSCNIDIAPLTRMQLVVIQAYYRGPDSTGKCEWASAYATRQMSVSDADDLTEQEQSVVADLAVAALGTLWDHEFREWVMVDGVHYSRPHDDSGGFA